MKVLSLKRQKYRESLKTLRESYFCKVLTEETETPQMISEEVSAEILLDLQWILTSEHFKSPLNKKLTSKQMQDSHMLTEKWVLYLITKVQSFITDPHRRAVTAQLLENQETFQRESKAFPRWWFYAL